MHDRQLDDLDAPNPDVYLQEVIHRTQAQCDSLETTLGHFQHLTRVISMEEEPEKEPEKS